MPYVVAVDGGATKTHGLIGDHEGNVLVEIKCGCSNHQVVGSEEAKRAIGEMLESLLSKAHLCLEDISLAFLGLAGADMPEDHLLLRKLLQPTFKNIPFHIVNDGWIALAAGTSKGWGAVSICGTGCNAAARSPEGQEAALRSLGYELGIFGGGSDLTIEAFHHAFRSEEGTGPKTALEIEIPKRLGVDKLADFVEPIYHQNIAATSFPGIPELVFELATCGDGVCQELLVEMGTIAGQLVAGVIRRTRMDKLEVPVVLAGSLYKGSNPLLIDACALAVHRVAPKAVLDILKDPPVMGAYREALRQLERLPK